MKNKTALMSIMALAIASEAMASEGVGLTERGSVGSGKQPKLPEPKKHTPFNKQERVLKIIKEFNLIINGKSKKGKRKQAIITSKIDKWLEDGWLKEEDIEDFPIIS